MPGALCVALRCICFTRALSSQPRRTHLGTIMSTRRATIIRAILEHTFAERSSSAFHRCRVSSLARSGCLPCAGRALIKLHSLRTVGYMIYFLVFPCKKLRLRNGPPIVEAAHRHQDSVRHAARHPTPWRSVLSLRHRASHDNHDSLGHIPSAPPGSSLFGETSLTALSHYCKVEKAAQVSCAHHDALLCIDRLGSLPGIHPTKHSRVPPRSRMLRRLIVPHRCNWSRSMRSWKPDHRIPPFSPHRGCRSALRMKMSSSIAASRFTPRNVEAIRRHHHPCTYAVTPHQRPRAWTTSASTRRRHQSKTSN